MKKLLALALAAIMVVPMFASCGDTEDTTAADTTAAETVEGEVTPAAAVVKVVDIDLTEEEYAFGVDKDQPELLEKVNAFIAKIQNDGTFDEICNNYFGDGEPVAVASAELDTTKDQLVVATNAAFEPFEYKLGDSYYGIDMEIAALLAEELGMELVISNMEFEAVCLSVGTHQCDIAMAGLTIKPEREEYVTFSDSYYSASQKVIVKADDTAFDGCADKAAVEAVLAGLDANTKIGVQNGTTGKFYVEGDEEWGFDGYDVTCVGYTNGSLAVQDLINGNINYVIIDSAPADAIVAAYNG